MASEPHEPQVDEDVEIEETQEPVGFWRRMFGGGGKADALEEEEAEAVEALEALDEDDEDDDGEMRRHAPAVNQPRKPRQTIFDKAEQEQRKRYARAAMVRRERMARAIGDRVEKVIMDRMESGEEKLTHVAGSFGEVRNVLGAIGRNLDDQGERSERIAEVLGQLPAASEREQKILGQIARTLEGQSGSSRTVAESVQDVPQMLALVRDGQSNSKMRLEALREVKSELALQRDQRERLLSTFREHTERFEQRMGRLEEALVTGAAQARNDAESMRRALHDSTERVLEKSEEDAQREDDRTSKLRSGLHALSRQLQDQNTLAGAAVRNQGEAMTFFQDSHGEMLDALQRTQHRTLKEMKRIQEEVQERADSLAWRGRLTLVGAAGAIALTFALLFRNGPAPVAAHAPAPQVAPQAQVEQQTLPASFKRAPAEEASETESDQGE
jgi:hypothetical protein